MDEEEITQLKKNPLVNVNVNATRRRNPNPNPVKRRKPTHPTVYGFSGLFTGAAIVGLAWFLYDRQMKNRVTNDTETITSMREKLAILQTEIKSKDKLIDEKLDKIDKLKGDIEHLRQTQTACIEDLNKTKVTTSPNPELEDKIVRLNQRIKELEKQIQDMEKQRINGEEQLEQIKEMNSKLSKSTDADVSKKLDEVINIMASFTNVPIGEDRSETILEMIKKLDENYKKQLKEIKELKDKSFNLDQELKDREDLIRKLVAERTVKETEERVENRNGEMIESLLKQIEDLKREAEQLRDQNKKLDLQLSESKKLCDASDDNINKTHKVLMEITSLVSDSKGTDLVSRVRNSLNRRDAELKSLAEERDSLIKQFNEAVVESNKRAARISSLEIEIDTLKASISSLNSTIEDLNKQIVVLNGENHRLKSERQEIEYQFKIVNSKQKELEDKEKRHEKDERRMSSRIAELKRKAQETQEKEKKVRVNAARVPDDSTQAIRVLKEQLDAAKFVETATEKRLSELESENARLRAELDSRPVEDLSVKIAERDREIEKCQKNLESIRAEQDKKFELLKVEQKRELDQYEKTIVDLEGQIRNLKTELREVDDMKTRLNEYHQSKSENDAKMRNIVDRYRELNAELEETNIKLAKSESTKTEALTVLSKCKEKLAESKENSTETLTKLSRYEEQVSKLSQTLEDKNVQIEKLREYALKLKSFGQEATAKLSELEALKKSLVSSEENVKNLELIRKKMEDKIREQEKLSLELNSIQKQKESLHLRNIELENLLKTSEKINAENIQKINDQEQLIRELKDEVGSVERSPKVIKIDQCQTLRQSLERCRQRDPSLAICGRIETLLKDCEQKSR